MRGYWRDETSTAEAFTADGWLRSTDLGRLDRDGNLVLVGRVSDMYIRGGYNVHPLEVEHVLAEHPAVAEVSVVGVPAHVIGEKGVERIVELELTDAEKAALNKSADAVEGLIAACKALEPKLG